MMKIRSATWRVLAVILFLLTLNVVVLASGSQQFPGNYAEPKTKFSEWVQGFLLDMEKTDGGSDVIEDSATGMSGFKDAIFVRKIQIEGDDPLQLGVLDLLTKYQKTAITQKIPTKRNPCNNSSHQYLH